MSKKDKTMYRFKCLAGRYAAPFGEFHLGQTIDIAEDDPKLIKFQNMKRTFALETVFSGGIPQATVEAATKAPEPMVASGDDHTAEGEIDELDVDSKTLEALRGFGVMKITQIDELGKEGLTHIDGIGSKRADQILAAVEVWKQEQTEPDEGTDGDDETPEKTPEGDESE